MKGVDAFVNLLKATRIVRVLTVLMIILIPSGYMNMFSKEVLLLLLLPVVIYSAFSIYNAHRDKDYELPKYFSIVIFVLLGVALIISFSNKFLFLATCAWIFLGVIYHTIARKIILGDAAVAGMTHMALPFIICSIIVGVDQKFFLISGVMFYFFTILIGPVTNLKDIKEDTIRGYKTLVNSAKNPKLAASIFLGLSFFPIIGIFLIFNLRRIWMIFFPILIFLVIIEIYRNKMEPALVLLRFYMISFFTIIIWETTSNIKIFLLASAIMFFQFLMTVRKI